MIGLVPSRAPGHPLGSNSEVEESTDWGDTLGIGVARNGVDPVT